MKCTLKILIGDSVGGAGSRWKSMLEMINPSVRTEKVFLLLIKSFILTRFYIHGTKYNIKLL